MSRSWRVVVAPVVLATIAIAAPSAHAIPALQLYSPDAVYDMSSESWIISDTSFQLWVVGNVGQFGTIYDVDLAASFYGTGGSILFTPIDGAPMPVIDPTPEDSPAFDNITHHAEYANADGHEFWSLGDLTSTSDAIMDYQPGGTGTGTGTILKYMITVSGYEAVHFDAFDHYFTGGNGASSASYQSHYVFAPFSHDATGGGGNGEAPEPTSLWLLGAGVAGMLVAARRKKKTDTNE